MADAAEVKGQKPSDILLPCHSADRTSGDLFDTTFGYSSYRKDLPLAAVGLAVVSMGVRNRTSGDPFDTTFGHSSYQKDLHVTLLPYRPSSPYLLSITIASLCHFISPARVGSRTGDFWRVHASKFYESREIA